MSETIPEGISQGEQSTSEISESPELTHSESTANSAPTQESNVNPNWNEALELLPDDMLRNRLTPVFEKWDKNNNSRFEKVQQEYAKYDPYKPLIENEVPFEEIQLAWQLREQIANDPKVIFERLAQHLGYDISSLLNGEQSQGLVEDNPEGTSNPEIAEIKRVQEMQNAYLAQQYQREQEIQQQQWEKEQYDKTAAELNKLEETYGKFDRNRAVQFAIFESNQTGKPVNIETGVKALMAYNDEIIKSRANNTAPNVFSGTGGMPSGQVDTSKMSDDEVVKYAAALAKAKNGG